MGKENGKRGKVNNRRKGCLRKDGEGGKIGREVDREGRVNEGREVEGECMRNVGKGKN